jgi:hypothetical protein
MSSAQTLSSLVSLFDPNSEDKASLLGENNEPMDIVPLLRGLKDEICGMSPQDVDTYQPLSVSGAAPGKHIKAPHSLFNNHSNNTWR